MKTIVAVIAFSMICLGQYVCADVVIRKDGEVVKVGRNGTMGKGKIHIQDCFTNEVSEYDAAKYGLRKGQDCKERPPEKGPVPKAPSASSETQPPATSPN